LEKEVKESMNNTKLAFSVFLALTILLFSVLACNVGQTEKETTLFDQYYTIEPVSLMESLKNGSMSAFTPTDERPEILPVDQQVPVNWFQADYFYIATTLYDRVLAKSLDGWQLSSMDFRLGCSKIQYGFQNGRFEYFKVVKEKDQESRMSRFIDVDPRGNFVHVIEEEYYPKLVDWEVIETARLKISADQALQIAESNGGDKSREAIGDSCSISLILSPSPASNKGWVVSYTRNDDRTSIFKIQIDPYTGETHIP
jgi:hypothetical protein